MWRPQNLRRRWESQVLTLFKPWGYRSNPLGYIPNPLGYLYDPWGFVGVRNIALVFKRSHTLQQDHILNLWPTLLNLHQILDARPYIMEPVELGVYGVWFRVSVVIVRVSVRLVQGSGLRVQGLRIMVSGSGFRVGERPCRGGPQGLKRRPCKSLVPNLKTL